MTRVCIGVVAGLAGFLLGILILSISKTSKRKANKKKPLVERIGGTMNVILIIVGVVLLAFTVAMIYLFTTYGTVPDTLVTCVFAACGGEFGVMGWIKTTKERNQSRRWELEDRKERDEPITDHVPPDESGNKG